MAVKKPILEIPVDDEKFKKFYALYIKYKESAAKDGVDAEKLGKRLQQSLRSVLGVQEQIASSSRTMATYWSSISSSTKTAYGNIHNAIGTLMKWTGVGGLVTGGSVGILGLGFDRLAGAASAGRRSSSGLGLTYGQQKAFTLSYDRLLDSAGFLGGVATGRGNIGSGAAGALFSLGLDPRSGGNTATMAVEALQRVRQLTLQTPDEQLGMQHEARRLGELGLTVEDLRRIKGLSAQEFEEYSSDYAKRTSQVDVTDRTLKQWQDFYVQLDTAGEKIKSALINGLTSLAKPLSELSEALGSAVTQLIGSQGFKEIIGSVTRGLQQFADYVSRDEFKKDVDDFAEAVSTLARKTVAALRWLNLIPDPNATPVPSRAERRAEFWGSAEDAAEKRRKARAEAPGGIWDWFKKTASGVGDWLNTPLVNSSGPLGGMEDWKRAIAKIETGGHGNPYGALGPWTSGDRAHGKYQVMGANIPEWTKRALGKSLTPEQFLADPTAQERVFEKIFGDYVKKYGSAEAASRAWFAGEGGMNNRYAADVNGTTVGSYGDKFSQNLAQPKVKIEVNNNTGGSAVVTTSAMGIPNI